MTFLREDLHHLSLPAGKTDLVVLSQSLHHVDAPEAVLGEAARILAPGGKIVVLELMPTRRPGSATGSATVTWASSRRSSSPRSGPPASSRSPARSTLAQASSPFRVFLLTGEKR